MQQQRGRRRRRTAQRWPRTATGCVQGGGRDRATRPRAKLWRKPAASAAAGSESGAPSSCGVTCVAPEEFALLLLLLLGFANCLLLPRVRREARRNQELPLRRRRLLLLRCP